MDIKVGYIVMNKTRFGDLEMCRQNTEEEALRWISLELNDLENPNRQLYILKVYMREQNELE
jgi:hypothetical protein